MATFNPSSLFGGALEHKHSEWAELANHDHVYVVQSVEKMSLLTGWDCDNHYKVIDETDKTLFNCAEDGSVAGKMLHGKDRDIKIHIIPKGGKKEILILQRPWTLTGQKAYMTDADGETGVRLGRLKRKGGLHNLSAHYEVHVQTVEKETQFYARALAVLPFKLTNFGLFDAEDNEIEGGYIKKDFSLSSVLKAAVGEADTYKVQFPPSFGVEARAAMVCAALFIDLIFFEEDE